MVSTGVKHWPISISDRSPWIGDRKVKYEIILSKEIALAG